MKISMDKEYPVPEAIKFPSGWVVAQWCDYGESVNHGCNVLIKKPRTVDVDYWINIYPDGACIHGIHSSRDAADRVANPIRIACINIKRTVTEGEGL